MKILIISDAWHPQVNGVVRTYEYLLAEMHKAGHETLVISPADFPLTIPLPGYSEIRLAVLTYKRLAKLADDFKPDVIHIATEGPLGWAGRKYCRKRSLPFTTSYHTHFPDYVAARIPKFIPGARSLFHSFGKHYVRRFHAPAQNVMIATQSLEDQLLAWDFKAPMKRVSRGVKLDQFYPGEKTLFHDLPGPIALYVGRVAIEKNLEDFLRMDWPGSKIIVGDGPSLGLLSNKYPEAHFTGKKLGEELAEHYRSADLFVFPSRTDTFGIVLIEALASGLPVAGYNVTGPRDIITSDYLGALHDHDLAEAARRAMQSGNRERCAAHAREHYTWEAAARQFEAGLRD